MRLTRIPTQLAKSKYYYVKERCIDASRISISRFSRLGSSRKKRGFLDWNNFQSLLLSLCSPPRCYPAQPARFPRLSFKLFLRFCLASIQEIFRSYFDRRGSPVRRRELLCHFLPLITELRARNSVCALFFFPFGPPSIVMDPTTMTEAVDAIHRIPNLSLFFGTNMIHSAFPFSNFVSYMETE